MEPGDWNPQRMRPAFARIANEERGRPARARLRRTLSRDPRYLLAAITDLYPEADGATEHQFDAVVMVGGLLSVYTVFPGDDLRGSSRPSMGSSLRLIRFVDGRPNDGVVRRFNSALASGPESLGHYLRQLVQLLAASDRDKRVGLDWIRLLDDILAWNARDAPVQRRWARDFWRRVPGEVTPSHRLPDPVGFDSDAEADDESTDSDDMDD